MSILDWVIIALLILWAAWAIVHMYRRKKAGMSCCGSCAGCSMNGKCASRNREDTTV